MHPLTSFLGKSSMLGEIEVPGDKSISHRSLIFASLANGKSTINGLLEAEDVLKTAEALKKMGVDIKKNQNGSWEVIGSGIAGLKESNSTLDMGNSGTSTRLLMGLVAPFNFKTSFNGDASLNKRPMQRVFDPISEIGAKVVCRDQKFLPATIIGTKNPIAIHHVMKVASAQVKSAIMLAAINCNGTTTIIEPEACRDHTEIMMKHLGLDIKVEKIEFQNKKANKISIGSKKEFQGKNFIVPGDISSAAFLIVAALIIPNSKIKIKNVGLNELRDGILQTLLEMGAKINLENERLVSGEKVADIVAQYSELKGINVPASRAPRMIDEYPILSIAAANAKGATKMNGLAELKVKESNRLQAIADGLESCGVKFKINDDSLEVEGGFEQPKKTTKIKTQMDHRIAMSFLIMGLKLEKGLEIDDLTVINTSFPNFITLLKNSNLL